MIYTKFIVVLLLFFVIKISVGEFSTANDKDVKMDKEDEDPSFKTKTSGASSTLEKSNKDRNRSSSISFISKKSNISTTINDDRSKSSLTTENISGISTPTKMITGKENVEISKNSSTTPNKKGKSQPEDEESQKTPSVTKKTSRSQTEDGESLKIPSVAKKTIKSQPEDDDSLKKTSVTDDEEAIKQGKLHENIKKKKKSVISKENYKSQKPDKKRKKKKSKTSIKNKKKEDTNQNITTTVLSTRTSTFQKVDDDKKPNSPISSSIKNSPKKVSTNTSESSDKNVKTEPVNRAELPLIDDENTNAATHNEDSSKKKQILDENEDNNHSKLKNDDDEVADTILKTKTAKKELKNKNDIPPKIKMGMNQKFDRASKTDQSSSHFVVFLFFGLFFVIIAYVVFQKRKKILGFLIEGKRISRSRRTSGAKDSKVPYVPLETEDKEIGKVDFKYVY